MPVRGGDIADDPRMSRGRATGRAHPAPAAPPSERILDAALEVFAEQGLGSGTLREITQRAEVNLAAVNYYFGSREALVRAVLERLAGPYVTARLDALTRYEEEAGAGPLVLERVVEAFVRPTVQMTRDARGGRPLIRLLLQVRAGPSPETMGFFIDRVDPVVDRFVTALQRALPGLGRVDALWRYNFALGALMQVLTDADPALMRLKRFSAGLCDTDDNEAVIAQLVAFIAGGLRAPSA